MSFWKAIVSNGTPRLEMITAPSPVCLRQQPRPEQLQQVLRFVRQNYDWSIVDLGRNLSFLGMSVLDEIDETCLVTTLDVPALHQAKQIVQTLMNTGYARNRLRLILNRVPQRLEVTPDGNRKDVRDSGLRRDDGRIPGSVRRLRRRPPSGRRQAGPAVSLLQHEDRRSAGRKT